MNPGASHAAADPSPAAASPSCTRAIRPDASVRVTTAPVSHNRPQTCMGYFTASGNGRGIGSQWPPGSLPRTINAR
jgi:hypothetical protein